MKPFHYTDYGPDDVQRAESALLTVWAALGDLTEDVVLIGGLVPRYICRPTQRLAAVTMDVDFGVTLEFSSGQYDTTKTRLLNHGFEWKENRFVRQIGDSELFVDFLAPRKQSNSPTAVMVDDVVASTVPGLDRALSVHRVVSISGHALNGAAVTEKVNVCEVGPFICLKLQAYAGRAMGKDVFDFVRAVRDYDGGSATARDLFHAENNFNPAYATAIRMLTERFAGPESKGPVDYAEFCAGTEPPTPGSDAFFRQQRVNDALDAARFILNTGANP